MPWPAPKLVLGGMPILKLPLSQRERSQGRSLESDFPESQLGGRFIEETHPAASRILPRLWTPPGTGLGEEAHVKLEA